MNSASNILERNEFSKAIIKNLDPRLRIIFAFAWSLLVACLHSSTLALAALAVSIILLILMPKNMKDFFKRLCVVNAFGLFMWLIIPFSYSSPGTIIASFGFLDVTSEGFNLMILLSIKMNAISIGFISLMASCPLFVLGQASLRLGISPKLVNIFLLTIRYIHVIFQQYQSLKNAMRMRAFKFKFNAHGIVSVGNLIGSLLIRSMDRAERVHAAMLCRGYTGTFWVHVDFSMNKTDIIFCIAMALTILTLGGLSWLPI